MILPEAETNAQMGKVEAIDVQDASLLTFDYLRLDDEDFEHLSFALANASAPEGVERVWDRAHLMIRGADAGRDVLLTRAGRAIGVMQCKRLESQLALPAVFREIAKLILFATVNRDIRFDRKLVYLLAVAKDPAGTVVDYFARRAELEPDKAADIRAAAREVRDSHVTLKHLSDGTAEQTVLDALPQLEMHLLRPVALNEWMGREASVSRRFFRQRMVVDHSAVAHNQAEIMAAIAGLAAKVGDPQPITDADLAILRESIEQTPESHRLNLGIAMLFGFPREMFVGRPALEKRVGRLARLLDEISEDYTQWVFAEADRLAEQINQSGEAAWLSPFALQIPLGFLSHVAKECLVEALSGSVMAGIMDKLSQVPVLADDDARLAKVRDDLLAQGSRYLQGDFSQLAGDPSLVAQKRELIDTLLAGVKDPAHLAAVLDMAISLLKPQMLTAAETLRAACKHPTTIVLTGSRGIDTDQSLKRIADSVRALEAMKASGGTI